MLRSEECLVEYDFRRGLVFPDRLTRPAHAHYLQAAQELLQLYRNNIGTTRQVLHQRCEDVLDTLGDCSSRRMAAFIKLLDDVSQFDLDSGRKSAALRQQVFQAAASKHPLVTKVSGVFTSDHWLVKQEIAKQLNLPWAEIERKLFADVVEFHTLQTFEGYDSPEALLARYNVAQVQACLYRATKLTLWAKSDLKTVIRAIKLSRLMHVIRPLGDSQFQFILGGPSSALRATRRYGVAMAKMIPMLLSCKDWRLSAIIDTRSGRPMQMQLSSEEGLTSPVLPPEEFDSEVEAELMAKWQADPVSGWSMHREAEPLVKNQKVYLPDFLLEHQSGKKLHIYRGIGLLDSRVHRRQTKDAGAV
ncbi:MAG: DUF790 family protein [Pirellulales bacterium]